MNVNKQHIDFALKFMTIKRSGKDDNIVYRNTGTSFIVNGNIVAGTSYSREHPKH